MRVLASRHRTAVLVAAFAAFGCSDDPGGPEPPGPDPEYLGATPAAVAANVNSLAVDVEATDYDEARLRLRTPGEPDETTPPYAFVGNHADVSALGLLADRIYQIDVLLTAGTETDSVDSFSHTTGVLPDWIPSIGSDGTLPGGGFLGLAHPGGPLIVDGQGRVRWYLTSEDQTLNNFQAHDSGEFTLFGTQDAVRQYRVLDERGEIVRTIGCVGLDTRFHEVHVMPGGDYWVMCDDPVPTDLSPRGGDANGTVNWTTLQHVLSDGTLDFTFNTRDHFSLDDIDPAAFVGATTVNITHGNAVGFDDADGVYLSFRSLNEVTKIDGVSGAVEWRLGGLANEFAITDPTRAFERQHGLRVAAPGVIQMLDNGTTAPSRVIRYTIDEQAMTATLSLEYTHAADAFTFVGGGTEVLPAGGALASFGQAGRVVALDAAGGQAFELVGLEGEYIFRAFHVPSLYASERRAE